MGFEVINAFLAPTMAFTQHAAAVVDVRSLGKRLQQLFTGLVPLDKCEEVVSFDVQIKLVAGGKRGALEPSLSVQRAHRHHRLQGASTVLIARSPQKSAQYAGIDL